MHEGAMEFRIADTFTASLGRLGPAEQKQVKMTAFDLQLNPANPGFKFHRVDRAKDKQFWSVRVSSDIRIICHRSANSLLLCYVDHHDNAYRWAERRKLETHPKTGAAQLVEVRERVEEVRIPSYVSEAPDAQEAASGREREAESASGGALFSGRSDDELLTFGVPEEWLSDVRNVDEEGLLDIAERLPQEAAEALLELAAGTEPTPVAVSKADVDPLMHPDAQRRFRLVTTNEELERALEYPWERWTVFLHPHQRATVEHDYSGPARVTGSAGTGKTIVALHRAVHLARANPQARVLLSTFSQTLARSLALKLRRLAGNEPRVAERIDTRSLDSVAIRLYTARHGRPDVAGDDVIRSAIAQAKQQMPDLPYGERFLRSEWHQIVDAHQVPDWESYRGIPRLGRKERLAESRRRMVWEVLSKARDALAERGLLTMPQVYATLAEDIRRTGAGPYDFVVMDEAQDVGVQELRFLAALGNNRPNSLFFAADHGQRIFQHLFSWKALGVDIRGRSRTLRINYRTSHQIRRHADRLLGETVSDADGNTDDRRGTVSLFSGPEPVIATFHSESDEEEAVGRRLSSLSEQGFAASEMAVFVRAHDQLARATAALEEAGFRYQLLDSDMTIEPDSVNVGTMHLAKGLEFRAVAVMCCDDEVIPLQERIEQAGDDADLGEVYETERHLLYVACTRARDSLLVTGVEPGSEFLEDMNIG